MTKSLIVANWKMNPETQKEAMELFDAVKEGTKNIDYADVVICPPFTFLAELKGMTLGGQDVYFESKGAFTGEVSPSMLKNLGVEYVIVGHSERRKYFGETNELINKKLKAVLHEGLIPIFCVGENEGEDRNAVLEKQLKEGLEGIDSDDILKLVVAYEPVWAIGTGKNCSVEDTKSAAEFIKNIVPGVRLLYGGSVKSENSGEYLKNADVDGLLVGGASLKADEFLKIVESAK